MPVPAAEPAPHPEPSPDTIVAGPAPRTVPFGALLVSAPVARALADMGYTTPTPIQTEAVPHILNKSDVVAQAQTGTGKTSAFGIPLAELLDSRDRFVQAIVLVPTRELAQQVFAEISLIARYRGLRLACVYGGQPIKGQIDALERGAHIIVGTPGRIMDHMERGTLRLDRVRIAVLDEADQMLDIGFFPAMRHILRATPRSRQTILLSATIPTPIKRLIYAFLRDPQTVRAGAESAPVAEVRQMYCEVAERDKLHGLLEILHTHEYDQALIFRRTQEGVEWLVRQVARAGHAVDGIHGALPQGQRNQVMQDFRDGKLKLLVATNLAARGIDVSAISNVINYDIPENVEEYVHRIGRTARMGRPGTAITFVAEWDTEAWDAIKAHVGEAALEHINLSLYR